MPSWKMTYSCVRNAIPSRRLVTIKASATVNSARYWLNAKSCEELSSKAHTRKCEYYLGVQEDHRLIRQRVSVEYLELTLDSMSATPPCSSLASVV